MRTVLAVPKGADGEVHLATEGDVHRADAKHICQVHEGIKGVIQVVLGLLRGHVLADCHIGKAEGFLELLGAHVLAATVIRQPGADDLVQARAHQRLAAIRLLELSALSLYPVLPAVVFAVQYTFQVTSAVPPGLLENMREFLLQISVDDGLDLGQRLLAAQQVGDFSQVVLVGAGDFQGLVQAFLRRCTAAITERSTVSYGVGSGPYRIRIEILARAVARAKAGHEVVFERSNLVAEVGKPPLRSAGRVWRQGIGWQQVGPNSVPLDALPCLLAVVGGDLVQALAHHLPVPA